MEEVRRQTRRQAEIDLWERIEAEDELRRKRREKELKGINGTGPFLIAVTLIGFVVTFIVALLIGLL